MEDAEVLAFLRGQAEGADYVTRFARDLWFSRPRIAHRLPRHLPLAIARSAWHFRRDAGQGAR